MVEVAEVEVELPVIFKLPRTVEEALEMKPLAFKRPVASTVVVPDWPAAKVLARKEGVKKELVAVALVTEREEREVRPERTERVPEKEAAEVIVWPLIKFEVMVPRLEVPEVSEVVKRLVEEALVE